MISSFVHQIFPAERLKTLDEIYHVREEEESFLNGISGTSMPTSASTPSETQFHYLDGKRVSVVCKGISLMEVDTFGGQGSPIEPIPSHSTNEPERSEGIFDYKINRKREARA